MPDDAYEILMERIEYPSSARLRRILEMLMTPEQARMLVELPGTPEEVAQKTGFSVEQVRASLDDLYFKGVAFPKDFDKRDFFRFARNITQLHDATQATQRRDVVKDREFYTAWHDFCINEWYPRHAQRSANAPRPWQRVIPAFKAIKDLPGVLPAENFHELLKAQTLIAVVPCSCRLRCDSVGEPCEHTDEVREWHCFQFGRGAEYAIKRGSGRKLTLEEALDLADKCEEDGLIHCWRADASMVGNTSCQCCRDCCQNLAAYDLYGVPFGKAYERSRYEAYIDQEDCSGCQDCIPRCQFDAIEMVQPTGSKKYKALVDPEKCWGCGACVVGCQTGAAKLHAVRPPEFIPASLT